MPFDQTVGSWDFHHLASNYNADVQTFFLDNTAATAGSSKWVKPRGVTMCFMIAVAGGSGGAGGRSRTSTNPGGGGGGGASGNISKLLVPAIMVPDVLWVQVGNGGFGGASSSSGSIGLSTTIFYATGITAVATKPNVVLPAAANNQTAPTGGGTGAAGAAGTTGAIATTTTVGAINGLGLTSFLVGDNGANGGVQTGAVGVDITAVWNLVCLSGGAGGAGVNTTLNPGFAGGNIVMQAALDFADGVISPASNFIAGGTAGGALGVPGGNGNSGIQLFKPFYMTGGSGGGSSDGDVGGNGGNGGYGCGGGGGGAGTTGGRGGNGGDGFAIIISW